MLHLRWSDSAPGVPEEVLEKLFERLFRIDESRSRKTGGSGLGLSIVSNIVEAHCGSINARTSPLGGLTLELTLPAMEYTPGRSEERRVGQARPDQQERSAQHAG